MAYILLVDDDKDLVEETAEELRKSGYEANFCLSTEKALELVNERAPDLMVLDIMFPESELAGFNFVHQLVAEFKGREKFPILMLSAINNYFNPGFSARDIDAQWMPVTDFLEKPVAIATLKRKIEELLEKAKQAVG
jgi:DNA-binding response OmpR family regulator